VRETTVICEKNHTKIKRNATALLLFGENLLAFASTSFVYLTPLVFTTVYWTRGEVNPESIAAAVGAIIDRANPRQPAPTTTTTPAQDDS
jgi:hypothetical protein